MRILRRIWMLLILFSILVFQNCARVNFSNGAIETNLKSENNGGVYGGKPTGTFYRFVADFTCEQKESPAAIVEINNSGVELIENKKLLCGASRQTLDFSRIDSSIYQGQIIGYLDGIFEGRDQVPNKIPSNLVEVWCKDRNDEKGIETIVHFDRGTNLAVNRIYYSSADVNGGFSTQEISDSPVARVISQNTVNIKDEKGFELIVHRDQPAAQIGLFKAEMQVVIAGETTKRDTSCRLGGSLDPSIWPSQQIVDMNILSFKTAPDKSSFAFTSSTATGNANLYSAQSDGTSLVQIAPNMLTPGILDFSFSPDSRTIVYRGSQRLAQVNELFKVNLDGSGNAHLGDDLFSDNHGDSSSTALTDVKFVNNGQTLIYKDGGGNALGSSALKLKSVSLNGSAPVILNPPFSDSFGVHAYNVSAQLGKIIMLEGSPYSLDLYSMDFDGSHVLKITPNLPDSSWKMNWWDRLNLSGGGRYVAMPALGSGTSTDFVIAIDGSGSFGIPDGWHWAFSNQTDTYAFLASQTVEVSPGVSTESKSESRVLNLKTKSLIKLPRVQDAFFTKNSENLVGVEVLASGALQTFIFSTLSQNQAELCPGVSGSLMKILEISPNRFVVVAYDGNRRILNVHLKNEALACVKVNSVPVVHDGFDFIRDVSLSPDQQKILVHLEKAQFQYSFQVAGIGNQIFYIPLNGRPGLQVNSPVSNQANISQALFLNDSQSVLYLGDQLRLNERNAFIWKAPK
jgi:hypothetical protein